jgi:hypothetical protein
MQDKIELQLCPVAGLDGFCWAWTGAKTSRGYGSVGYQGRIWSTHKLAYELLIAPVPEGLQCDHLCRNIVCCNPEHIEPVTAQVNNDRKPPKLRCDNGHPLAGPNARIKQKVGGGTQRDCRACRADERARADDARGRKRRPSHAVATRRAVMLAESEAALRELIAVVA